MIIDYAHAPECVRKLAFSLMRLSLYRELQAFDDPRPLLYAGNQAGIDAATHAEALRWLARQELDHIGERSGVISLGTRKAAVLYTTTALKIEGTLPMESAAG